MSAAAAPALTMGTPHAAHLQQTIQKELARLEYSDDDPVMAEVGPSPSNNPCMRAP